MKWHSHTAEHLRRFRPAVSAFNLDISVDRPRRKRYNTCIYIQKGSWATSDTHPYTAMLSMLSLVVVHLMKTMIYYCIKADKEL